MGTLVNFNKLQGSRLHRVSTLSLSARSSVSSTSTRRRSRHLFIAADVGRRDLRQQVPLSLLRHKYLFLRRLRPPVHRPRRLRHVNLVGIPPSRSSSTLPSQHSVRRRGRNLAGRNILYPSCCFNMGMIDRILNY